LAHITVARSEANSEKRQLCPSHRYQETKSMDICPALTTSPSWCRVAVNAGLSRVRQSELAVGASGSRCILPSTSLGIISKQIEFQSVQANDRNKAPLPMAKSAERTDE
jgi:hypothetical protein